MKGTRADMNAAIVDDQAEDIELLCSYLSRYSQEHKTHIYIKKFTDADTFLKTVCRTAYHLVFLDNILECQKGIDEKCRHHAGIKTDKKRLPICEFHVLPGAEWKQFVTSADFLRDSS